MCAYVEEADVLIRVSLNGFCGVERERERRDHRTPSEIETKRKREKK